MPDIGALVPGMKAVTTLSVTANKILPTGGATCLVNTSGGAQTLNEIAADCRDGSQVVLGISSASNSCTVKHNTGTNKMMLTGAADVVIDATTKFIWLQLNSGIWYELGRFGFPGTVYASLPTTYTLAADVALNVSNSWFDVFDLGTPTGNIVVDAVLEVTGAAVGLEYQIRLNNNGSFIAGADVTSTANTHYKQICMKYKGNIASGSVKVQAMVNGSTAGVVKKNSTSGYLSSVCHVWQ